CHARGLLPKGDMVRAHVDKNRKAFTAADVDTVLALYPPKTRLQKSIDEDNERYTKALTALAIAPDADEPVNLVTRRYEAPRDIALAAAEIGVERERFRARLAGEWGKTRHFGPLAVQGG